MNSFTCKYGKGKKKKNNVQYNGQYVTEKYETEHSKKDGTAKAKEWKDGNTKVLECEVLSTPKVESVQFVSWNNHDSAYDPNKKRH